MWRFTPQEDASHRDRRSTKLAHCENVLKGAALAVALNAIRCCHSPASPSGSPPSAIAAMHSFWLARAWARVLYEQCRDKQEQALAEIAGREVQAVQTNAHHRGAEEHGQLAVAPRAPFIRSRQSATPIVGQNRTGRRLLQTARRNPKT